jgi:hypothetical protein
MSNQYKNILDKSLLSVVFLVKDSIVNLMVKNNHSCNLKIIK